jgi:hypothetical protein
MRLVPYGSATEVVVYPLTHSLTRRIVVGAQENGSLSSLYK